MQILFHYAIFIDYGFDGIGSLNYEYKLVECSSEEDGKRKLTEYFEKYEINVTKIEGCNL